MNWTVKKKEFHEINIKYAIHRVKTNGYQEEKEGEAQDRAGD